MPETVVAPASPQPTTPSATPFNDAFSDLDKYVSQLPPPDEAPPPTKQQPKPQPQPKAETQPEPPEPEPEPQEPAPEAPEEQPAKEPEPEPETKPEAKEPTEPESDEFPEKPKNIPELRKAYTGVRKQFRLAQQEIGKLKTQLDTITKAAPKPVDTKPFEERISGLQKQIEDYETKLSFYDYKESKEFKEKHEEPWKRAWQRAERAVSEIVVEREDGTVYRPTYEDFQRLVFMSRSEARKLAKEMYGEDADAMMVHRDKIKELEEEQDYDLKTHQQKAKEFVQKNAEESKQAQQARSKAFNERIAAHVQKYPQWFKPVEGDTEGNALLEKGISLVNRLFSNGQKLTPEEALRLNADVYTRAAAFGRVVFQAHKLQQELAQVKKALAQYEKSTPKPTDRSRKPEKKPATWEDSFEALPRVAG